MLEEIHNRNIFGYLQCDLDVPGELRAKFAILPPFFENTSFSKNDIDDLMRTYAEEEDKVSQPRKMLISSFTLQKSTMITPVLLFYLQFRLVCTKIHRFVESTPKKCFNSFVQSAVDATR